MSMPLGIAVSGDDRIHVASAGSGAVMTFDPTGRLLHVRHCRCEISGLFPVRGALYRLTERIDRTLFLFEGLATGPRILFVPPADGPHWPLGEP
jgi:hypothetical protein